MLLAGMVLGFAGPLPALESADFLKKANEERAAAGLPILLSDEKLNALAADWAVKAAENKSLAHRKELPNLRASQGWNYLNENIYSGSGVVDAARVFRIWMKSPGHRRNLMNTTLTHAGFGFATNKDGETYVVFNGGTR